MRRVGARRPLAAFGAYWTVTGVSPFVSRRLFEAVTGPKAEWWLVQTVGALVTAVGATALGAAARDRVTPEVHALAVAGAASLATIDIVHVARRRIAPTYLLDAAVEAGLIAALLRARPAPIPHPSGIGSPEPPSPGDATA